MIRRNQVHIWVVLFCITAFTLGLLRGTGQSVMSAASAKSVQMLEISASARPDALVEPGEVTLSFSIVNTSAENAENVLLTSADGLLSEPVGSIAAGETQRFSRTHSVTREELDAGGILYIISHDDPANQDAKINYNVWAAISRSSVEPAAEFTRRFSSRRVAAGDSVVVTYRIRNTGNVALTGLTVYDDLGQYTGRVERLDVGESRTLINRAAITQETVSHAMLSYSAEDTTEVMTQTLEDMRVYPVEGQLECVLRAGYSAFSASTADVVMLLSATGDMGYRDLRITDETYGGVIADQLSVQPGEEALEISRSCPIRGDASFCWRVTGVDEAGKRIDLVSNIARLPEREAALTAKIEMQAATNTPRIRRSGDVRIRLTISNTGGENVRALTLSEASQGVLREFEILPADGVIERDFLLHVEDDADFSFTLEYTLQDGTRQSAAPAAVHIAMASDGALPEGATPGLFEFSGGSIKIAGSSTFAVLLIIGCVVLLTLIVMLLIASRRARIQRQLRAVAEKQRRRGESGKAGRAPTARNKGKGRE